MRSFYRFYLFNHAYTMTIRTMLFHVHVFPSIQAKVLHICMKQAIQFHPWHKPFAQHQILCRQHRYSFYKVDPRHTKINIRNKIGSQRMTFVSVCQDKYYFGGVCFSFAKFKHWNLNPFESGANTHFHTNKIATENSSINQIAICKLYLANWNEFSHSQSIILTHCNKESCV